MCDQTHDRWMEGLFEEAGRQLWEERVKRLLHEFRVLGETVKEAAEPIFDDVGDM